MGLQKGNNRQKEMAVPHQKMNIKFNWGPFILAHVSVLEKKNDFVDISVGVGS